MVSRSIPVAQKAKVEKVSLAICRFSDRFRQHTIHDFG